MLPTRLSALIGVLFVLLAVGAVWLMFDGSRNAPQSDRARRMIRAHRVAGYLFIALFCIMTWFMILKIKDRPDELPLPSMFHALIAVVMAPLLFIKVLVARYYRNHTTILVPLGLTIFVLAFVLVVTTAGPYFLRTVTVKNISLQAIDMGVAKIDLQASEALMQRRCSRCHNLDRVVGAKKDARGWLATVDRMRSLPGSGISESDEKIILSYLLSEDSINSSSAQGELVIGKALVDSHCSRCHALDRTYQTVKTASEWNSTVTRMVNYARGAEGFFKPGEADRIIHFLSATQTSEARSSPPIVADAADRSTAQTAAKVALSSANLPTIGVLFAVCGVFGLLLLRPNRPQHPKYPGPTGVGVTRPTALASPNPPATRTLLLQLVRTERQTPDCISLRFRLGEGSTLRAKPGQFLTFDWLLNGQKLRRSFSISSSTVQTGLVEITVKKNPKGCVSHFLNERAAVGLTVEAHGPYGRFYFDESIHKRIVLFAGGSGITPMMSMLRYIDDLALDAEVTLFYSVRTREDIIFGAELEMLEERLASLHRVVVLTRPDDGWGGEQGRLSGELIVKHLGDFSDRTFFLCGPQPFMEHVKGLLLAAAVPAEKILEERFDGGKTGIASEVDNEASLGTVEFSKSGKSTKLLPGQSLLEAAEANGVTIPYGCRQGQCGTCATRLLEGEVDSAGSFDPGQGYVLTCVTRARGNVRLDA
ncbi:MAG: oxidoreductase, FAD-binding [Candidatus Solibacter sp.]|nr:oxidoreductase, FAD-binding [Candidatus Solibacter sp.]